MKYLLLTVTDARLLLQVMRDQPINDAAWSRLHDRLERDTGADVEEIAATLKQQTICPACSIEGQAAHCNSLDAQKVGRRLARLIERALGTRAPGAVDPSGTSLAEGYEDGYEGPPDGGGS